MQNNVPNSETLWLPAWDASYAANTGHHRVLRRRVPGLDPALPRRSHPRPRLRLGRLHPHVGGPGARGRGGRPRSPAGAVGRGPRPRRRQPDVRRRAGPAPRSPAPRAGPVRRRDQPGRHAMGPDGRPPRLPRREPPAAASRRVVPPGDGRRRQHRADGGQARGDLDGPRRASARRGRSPTPGPTSNCSRRPASRSTRGRGGYVEHGGPAAPLRPRVAARLAAQPVLPGLRDRHAGRRARRLPGRGRGPPGRARPPRRHVRPDLRPPQRAALARTPSRRTGRC